MHTDLGADVPTSDKTALLVIDVQADFLPKGSLAVPDGDKIFEAIEAAAKHVDLIGATGDGHTPDHISFGEGPDKWPVHCVAGTPGAEIHPRVLALKPRVFWKATEQDVDSYSGFGNPDLDAWLKDNHIRNVLIAGLAADFCVKETALSAKKLGYNVTVLLEGVRGVFADTTDAALHQLAAKGIELR